MIPNAPNPDTYMGDTSTTASNTVDDIKASIPPITSTYGAGVIVGALGEQ